MLFHLFNKLRESVPGANVFRYVSTRIGLATLSCAPSGCRCCLCAPTSSSPAPSSC